MRGRVLVCDVSTVHGAGERRRVDGQDADSRDAHLRRQSQRQTERRHFTDHVSFRRRGRSQGLSVHVQ